MKTLSYSVINWRLAQLASHLVVALIALVVIGGATRVMEAGLACPDWPLCYGSFLPGKQMNVQVFLEWFHRLDAFLIGIALLIQLFLSFLWRSFLPKWLLLSYSFLVLLVIFQGGLGALTVLRLLPSGVVMAHLALALTLVAAMSGLSQRLLSPDGVPAPSWWRFLSGGSLFAVFVQSLIGSRMATSWAAQKCISRGISCEWLDLHQFTAAPVTIFVLAFVFISIFVGGWPRMQWPFLLAVFILLATQISLGVFSLQLGLAQPVITVGHQLVAALLVALLSALTFRRPDSAETEFKESFSKTFLEQCHG